MGSFATLQELLCYFLPVHIGKICVLLHLPLKFLVRIQASGLVCKKTSLMEKKGLSAVTCCFLFVLLYFQIVVETSVHLRVSLKSLHQCLFDCLRHHVVNRG